MTTTKQAAPAKLAKVAPSKPAPGICRHLTNGKYDCKTPVERPNWTWCEAHVKAHRLAAKKAKPVATKPAKVATPKAGKVAVTKVANVGAKFTAPKATRTLAPHHDGPVARVPAPVAVEAIVSKVE